MRSTAAMTIVWVVAALLAVPASAQENGPVVADPVDGEVVLEDGTTMTLPGVFVLPEEADTPLAVSLAISRLAFERADTVIIARDDVFVDSLAAGVLQGREAPLLLVPSDGPVPLSVLNRIAALGATTAVLLGGEVALGVDVADSLADAGLTVRRVSGADRTATAVAVANEADTGSTTAILARAFPADPDNPTQAWADSVAAGAWAAGSGHPILITATDTLSGATRDELADGGYERVVAVGGTAAISDDVLAEVGALGLEVQRIAGDSRFETAIEIAEAWDAEVGAVGPAVLATAEGADDWATGLPLASLTAIRDARIVLVPSQGPLPDRVAERFRPQQRQLVPPSTLGGGPGAGGAVAGLIAGTLLLRILLGGGPKAESGALASFAMLDADGALTDRLDRGGHVGFIVSDRLWVDDPYIDLTTTSADGGRFDCSDETARRQTERGEFYGLSLARSHTAECVSVQDGEMVVRYDDEESEVVFSHTVILGDGPPPGVLIASGTVADGHTSVYAFSETTDTVAAPPVERVVPASVWRIDSTPLHHVLLATDDRGDDVPALLSMPPGTGSGPVPAESLTRLWEGADGGTVTNPSVSPDGSTVAFSWSEFIDSGVEEQVATIATDGSDDGQATPVDTGNYGFLNDQAWSANGDSFVYWAGDNAQDTEDRDKRTVGFPGNGAFPLRAGGFRPALSPAGRLLDLDGLNGTGLTLMDTASAGATERTASVSDADALSAPTFDPAGELFAVVRYTGQSEDAEADLVIHRLDLTEVVVIDLLDAGIKASGPFTSPEWGPDGQIAIPGVGGVGLVEVLDGGESWRIHLEPVEGDTITDVSWIPPGTLTLPSGSPPDLLLSGNFGSGVADLS